MDENDIPLPFTPPRFADVRELLERVLRGMAQEWLLSAEMLARAGEEE